MLDQAPVPYNALEQVEVSLKDVYHSELVHSGIALYLFKH
jgi:phenylpropionate dioxygenase-like ring-hydroxylating dioxygenase large terminal subunit